MRISEKYLAGFLDADGSFGIKFRRLADGRYNPYIWLQASQKVDSGGFVIRSIAETYGGNIMITPKKNARHGDQIRWDLPPKQARVLLARIMKFFVLRRTFAQWCLNAEKTGPLTRAEMEALRDEAKVKRFMRSDPLPNFPSRKWTAGYIDGNGCFASRLNRSKHCTPAVLWMSLADDVRDTEGLELLQKAFGGQIYSEPTRATWNLHLEPSKAREFIPFFAKHLVMKQAQAYFVLGCADGGNYRDGEPIHRALQHLKVQEQRLSDLEVDVSFLLRRVRFDIPSRRGWHMKIVASI